MAKITVTIEIDEPVGWEFDGYRVPEPTDATVNETGHICIAKKRGDHYQMHSCVVFKKKPDQETDE